MRLPWKKKNCSLTIPEARNIRWRFSLIWFLMRVAAFLLWPQVFPQCVHMNSKSKWALQFLFLSGYWSHQITAPSLWLHITLNTSLEVPFSNTATLCIRASAYEGGGWYEYDMNIQSITVGDCNGIRSHHFMANRWGNNGNRDRLYFLGLQKSLPMVTAATKSKDTCSLEEQDYTYLHIHRLV